MSAWADKYEDQGLVVVGVHAPEFGFEHDLTNVRHATDELKVTYRVEVGDSGLVMKHPRHGTIALTRLWKDDFGGSMWFTRSVEFQRDASGRVVGFSVFIDERSRDVRFTKRS